MHTSHVANATLVLSRACEKVVEMVNNMCKLRENAMGLERARGPYEVGRLAILKTGAPAGGPGREGMARPVCWMWYLSGF